MSVFQKVVRVRGLPACAPGLPNGSFDYGLANRAGVPHIPGRPPLDTPSCRGQVSKMCGIFGVFGHPEAANLTYLGLHALQHRGQESAGMVTSDGEQLIQHRGMGHVHDVFPQPQLDRLKGRHGIGHVRYSTSGLSALRNAQPIAVDYSRGSLAVAHNGNLTNAEALRDSLEAKGSIFQSTSDTEVIVHLIAISSQQTIEDRIADAMRQVQGAYSCVFLSTDSLIAVRDAHGIRPLCIGRLRGENGPWVVSSEPSSFELLDATFVRDVQPGEMVILTDKGMRRMLPFAPAPRKMCILEYVYFARPDATLDGINVYEARKSLGRALADEHPVEADVAVPVPDSGVPATIGYAERTGIPFEMGLVRSHYVGRTFIEPSQSIRHFGVRLKLSPIAETLRGKRVVVIDDSIIRGTTSRKIVKMLRAAGAKEVHLRISSPPYQWPCYYGIDTPTRTELIASSHSVDEINQYVTSDTLGYLSLERMTEAVVGVRRPPQEPERNVRHLSVVTPKIDRDSFCHACWSGVYPVQFQPHPRQRQMRLLDL